MIRQPSDREELYRWHAQALAGLVRLGVHDLRELAAADPEAMPQISEGDPQCGYFLAKVRRFAVPVPAKIYVRSVVDDDGELVEPEVIKCELGGTEYDPLEAWPRLCIRPISRSEYAYLMSVRAWAHESAPDQPQARTGRPIDWMTVQLPEVPKGPSA